MGVGKGGAKVETRGGTKETRLDGNSVFCEEIEWQYASDNSQRLPLAPERHGVRSVEGPTRITWSGSTEMAMPDQFDSSDTPPHPDWWLKACGFARDDFSSVAHEVALYVLQSTAHESISFEAMEFTADGTSVDYIQARGARCGWELSIADGERGRPPLVNGLATKASTATHT